MGRRFVWILPVFVCLISVAEKQKVNQKLIFVLHDVRLFAWPKYGVILFYVAALLAVISRNQLSER